MKKRIYVLDTKLDTPLYFGTAKKVHAYCLAQKLPVHKKLSVFNRWLFGDGKYEITGIGWVTFSEIL